MFCWCSCCCGASIPFFLRLHSLLRREEIKTPSLAKNISLIVGKRSASMTRSLVYQLQVSELYLRRRKRAEGGVEVLHHAPRQLGGDQTICHVVHSLWGALVIHSQTVNPTNERTCDVLPVWWCGRRRCLNNCDGFVKRKVRE